MQIIFLIFLAVLFLAASLFRFAELSASDGGSGTADFISSNETTKDVLVESDHKKENDESKEHTAEVERRGEATFATVYPQMLVTDETKGLVLVVEKNLNRTFPVDCCPSTFEVTTPSAARNMRGDMVTLYSSEDARQQFMEVSCREDVADQPCRFMHRLYHNRSKCVQKYSYSYALVLTGKNQTKNDSLSSAKHPKPLIPTPFHTNTALGHCILDHIRVRSGCICEVEPKKPKSDSILKNPKTVTKIRRRKTTATTPMS